MTEIVVNDKFVKNKNFIITVLFVAYFVFNLYLLIVHEMWRDEINVWLMGRDLSIFQLFRELRFQGHPCLWYLIVMPFAKVGFPCWTMGILSMLAMSIACFIVLKKAPIGLVAKSFLIFSPLFTYYYSVIARGYCLVALLIVLLALYYKERFDRPLLYGALLGLLVQADTIAVPVAGFISMIWGLEAIGKDMKQHKVEKLWNAVKGLWIPLVSLVVYILTMAKVSDSPVFEIKDLGLYDMVEALKQFAYYIMERLTGVNKAGCFLFFIMFLIVGLWMAWYRHSLLPLFVLVGTYAFQVIFSVFVYELNIWHFLSIGFVLLWMLWVYEVVSGEERNKFVKVMKCGTSALLIVFAICMMHKWTIDTTSGFANAMAGSYSDAKNTAAYIKKNIDADEIIVETDIPYGSSIWGYAPGYKPYFVGNGQQVSYADWSEKQSGDKTWSKLLEWFEETFPEEDSFILICTNDSHLLEFDDAIHRDELIYETKEPSARQEDYQIYRISVR